VRCLFYLFFCDPGVWTQRLMLVRQVLYHFSHNLDPFCF
jgi:hypothetical protein